MILWIPKEFCKFPKNFTGTLLLTPTGIPTDRYSLESQTVGFNVHSKPQRPVIPDGILNNWSPPESTVWRKELKSDKQSIFVHLSSHSVWKNQCETGVSQEKYVRSEWCECRSAVIFLWLQLVLFRELLMPICILIENPFPSLAAEIFLPWD